MSEDFADAAELFGGTTFDRIDDRRNDVRRGSSPPGIRGVAGAELNVGGVKVARGRPRSPNRKLPLKLRLDPDVVARFRATGPGWQSRMNAALRRAAQRLGAKRTPAKAAKRIATRKGRAAGNRKPRKPTARKRERS